MMLRSTIGTDINQFNNALFNLIPLLFLISTRFQEQVE
jgi:hypothetical protein